MYMISAIIFWVLYWIIFVFAINKKEEKPKEKILESDTGWCKWEGLVMTIVTPIKGGWIRTTDFGAMPPTDEFRQVGSPLKSKK